MKYNKKVLSNGLRIITVPMKESETAIATIFVEIGSDYETKQNNGISHFLEHMFFKGTKNRTGKEINIELDSLGSENNAYTSSEITAYHAKARYKKVNKIIDIISDMYLNPTFPEKDIETERGVILEEVNMYKDLPQRQVLVAWQEMLHPKQPHGMSTIGTEINIKKFKRNDLVEYYEKHYVPNKTIIVVAGKIDEKQIIKKIKEKFGSLKNSKIIKKEKYNNNQKTPQVKINYKKSDQTHIVMGFRSYDLYNEKNYALRQASTILGGGMSSRLFQKMREELGICYYVRSANYCLTDYGYFFVSIGVGNSRTEEAVKVLVEEFKKIRDEGVTKEEISRAKDIILGNIANGLETSADWAEYYGEQETLHEKITTPKEDEKKVRSVTEKDIKKVLNEVIQNKNLNLAIVGPHKNSAKFKKLLKI